MMMTMTKEGIPKNVVPQQMVCVCVCLIVVVVV